MIDTPCRTGEVDLSQSSLAGVGFEPIVYEDLVATVVGERCLDYVLRQVVIVSDLCHITVDRLEVAHEGPDRYRVPDDTSLGFAGPIGIALDVLVDELLISHFSML